MIGVVVAVGEGLRPITESVRCRSRVREDLLDPRVPPRKLLADQRKPLFQNLKLVLEVMYLADRKAGEVKAVRCVDGGFCNS